MRANTPLDRCYSASNSAVSVGLLTEGWPMHALLIRHNYVAKHVTPSTHPPHPPHPIPPRYFSKGAGSWVISHDWCLLSFLGNCCAKDDRRYKHHQSASASHSVFNVCRGEVKWTAADYVRRCRSAGSIIYILFRLLFSAWPSSTPVLICDQRLSTFCQHDRRDVAHGEEPLSEIMTLKGSVAKSGSSTSQPEFYWRIKEIAYILQENQSWGFSNH